MKMKPKKEIISKRNDYGCRVDFDYYFCPRCDALLGYNQDDPNICHMCGQELDWGRVKRHGSRKEL